MINAGKYNKRIEIHKINNVIDSEGFSTPTDTVVLNPYASIKTTRGMTIIRNNSDFEKAYTNFTIRYPNIEITRDMTIVYHGKRYTIEYLNNVDEKSIELEIQAKEVTH